MLESKSGSSVILLTAILALSFAPSLVLWAPIRTFIVVLVTPIVHQAFVNTWLFDINVPPHLHNINNFMLCLCVSFITQVCQPIL